MTIEKITRVVYCLLGVVYVLIGAGSMLIPTGWLPQSLTDEIMADAVRSSFVKHLLQEFGTVVLALGLVFLWYANRKEHSHGFHWAMTFYFLLDALIHWIGPEGLIGSWPRGIANTIPLAVMLLLGLLQRRVPNRMAISGPSERES